MDNIAKIHRAWDEEGSIARLGMRPSADKSIQAALVPAGGDWQCVAAKGAITRTIIWRGTEVALVNPRGDMNDRLEGDIAMGLRATPVMYKSLRCIFALAGNAENLDLIRQVACAAIAYVEQAPPPLELDDEPEDEEGA